MSLVTKDPFDGWGCDDTSPEAERVQTAILRRLPVRRRLALVDQLYELTTSLALADLRRRNPGASDARVRLALIERLRRGASHQAPEQA